MTVKELKSILCVMPDDAEVVITVEYTNSVTVVALNDPDSYIDHKYVELR